MGAKQVICKYLDPANDGNQQCDISEHLVTAQVGQRHQAKCCNVDNH